MVKIVFKNLEKSELAKNIVVSRVDEIIQKFPDLINHKIHVTLSMENSKAQPGPDLFGVKMQITGPKLKNIILEKKTSNLYITTAVVCDLLLERLNRNLDKNRVNKRNQARQVKEESLVDEKEEMDKDLEL